MNKKEVHGMLRLITKEFIVHAPIERAWQHLIRVSEWTSFRVIDFEPGKRWL